MHQDKKRTKGGGVMRGLGAALPESMQAPVSWLSRGLFVTLAALAPTLAAAQDAAEAAPVPDKGDTAWMITSTLLVILMAVPGLALFYGGLGRSKNMLSVLMQVFVIFSLISILWAVYGYSLAFSGEGNFFGGFDKIFLKGVTTETFGALTTIPEYVFVAFQGTFAAITVALIVGSFAERIKFAGVLVFALAGLGCSALLPLTISFGQHDLAAVGAALSGLLIASYQVGYGIAAFGYGPIQDVLGVGLAAMFALAAGIAVVMGAMSLAIVRGRQMG